MTDIIARFRRLPIKFNPGADPQNIALVEKDINASLPEDLSALYLDHDGVADLPDFGYYRLLSLNEVADLHGKVAKLCANFGLRLFWTNDNSDYVCLYVEGPLKGRLCYFEHDGKYTGDLSPVFRSVESWYAKFLPELERSAVKMEAINKIPEETQASAMMKVIEEATSNATQQGAKIYTTEFYDSISEGLSGEFYDLESGVNRDKIPLDYPNPESQTSEEERADDESSLEALLQKFGNSTDGDLRTHLAFCIMRLIPQDRSADVIAYLWDADMWIQEKAVENLSERRYEPAIPEIAQVLRRGMHNGKTAAFVALRDWKHPQAEAELRSIWNDFKSKTDADLVIALDQFTFLRDLKKLGEGKEPLQSQTLYTSTR